MPTWDGAGRVGDAVEAGGDWVWTDPPPNTASSGPEQLTSNAVTALDAALGYMRRGWPLFPCQWARDGRKRPLIERGLHAAARDEAQIRDWWCRWPHALIGVPTGRATGFVVLDVDIKDHEANGFDTLADLGHAILPQTPMVHTGAGGLHLYFWRPDHPEIRCTAGERGSGIGRGLDWRGEGGYVILPAPDSGYHWDPHWNFETVPLAAVLVTLLPRSPERPASTRPAKTAIGLSPYAEAALDKACRRIIAAPAGEQELTLNSECFGIGTLAAAGAIPRDFARRTLIWSARQIPDHDHRHPWRARQIDAKVNRAFGDGMRRPRKLRRG